MIPVVYDETLDIERPEILFNLSQVHPDQLFYIFRFGFRPDGIGKLLFGNAFTAGVKKEGKKLPFFFLCAF